MCALVVVWCMPPNKHTAKYNNLLPLVFAACPQCVHCSIRCCCSLTGQQQSPPTPRNYCGRSKQHAPATTHTATLPSLEELTQLLPPHFSLITPRNSVCCAVLSVCPRGNIISSCCCCCCSVLVVGAQLLHTQAGDACWLPVSLWVGPLRWAVHSAGAAGCIDHDAVGAVIVVALQEQLGGGRDEEGE